MADTTPTHGGRMTAQHYEGKLKADANALIGIESGYRKMAECCFEHSFSIDAAVANAAELSHRWNQHPDQQTAIRELCEALKFILLVAGNLSDDAITTRSGPNDAVARGLMVCNARDIARSALAKHQPKDGL